MSIKSMIKSNIPDSMMERIQRARSRRALNKYMKTESKRFASSFAVPSSYSKRQVESRLVFYVHQIEKGFSFETYGYGRGHSALSHIAALFQKLSASDASWRQNAVYKEAILALGEYRRRHVQANKDISFMDGLFDSETRKEIKEASQKVYQSIEIVDRPRGIRRGMSFAELTRSRHAVRTYSKQPVARAELEEAITLALRTPSVCNRQPARVRIYTDSGIIRKALRIQSGFGGYDLPPALVLVTADQQAFIGVNEHNEGYVDGGLFAMSLLYALEACDLAACPLNTMFNASADKQTRQLLNIPDNEVFIMYIAVGHFNDVSKICLSKRFDLRHILVN